MPNYTESETAQRRRQVMRKVLDRHRGARVEIARSLKGKNGKSLSQVNITQVLDGTSRSARVIAAVERKVIGLLIAEEAEKIAAEHRPHDISVREALEVLRNRK